LVLGLLLYYFASHSNNKPIHYVKKNENKIQVTLYSPPQNNTHKETSESQPKKTKPKRVIREKVVKKKKRVVKKKSSSDLFANVKMKKKKKKEVSRKKKSSKKNVENVKSVLSKSTKRKESVSQHIKSSLKKQKNSDSGIENEYLSKVQEMLEGWPAQSEYAGENVKVLLYIETNGMFTFKLKTISGNVDFNRGLSEYLTQLKINGFGYHKGGRTYKIEVEFIAKD